MPLFYENFKKKKNKKWEESQSRGIKNMFVKLVESIK